MATSQFWYHTWQALPTAAASFSCLLGGKSATQFWASTTETRIRSPIAAAGNLKSLTVVLSGAPGGSASYRFQVVVNGTPSTSLDLTITGAATSGTVAIDVAVSPSDLVSVKVTPSSTPAAQTATIAVEFRPTTTDEFCYPAHYNDNNSVSGSDTFPQFAPLLGSSRTTRTTDTIGNITRSIVPFAGTITGFFVHLDTSPGTSKSWDFRVNVNGVEQAASAINISGASTDGNVTGLSIAVAAGDQVSFEIKAANGTPASALISYCAIVVPTTAGFWALTGTDNNNLASAGGTQYFLASQYQQGPDATEANVQQYAAFNQTLKALYLALATAPGGSASWTFTSRKNAGAGSLTFAISAGATTGHDSSHSDVFTVGDLLDLQAVPASAPATSSGIAWAFAVGPSAVTVTLDVATAASIGIDHTQDVATAAALSAPDTKDVTTAAALATEATKDALTAASIAKSATKDVATAAAIALPKIWADIRRELDPADWPSAPVVYLEVHGETANPAEPFEAALFNETLGALVAGSTVLITASSKTRGRSGPFSLASGPNVYYVVFQEGHPMYDAVLILDVG